MLLLIKLFRIVSSALVLELHVVDHTKRTLAFSGKTVHQLSGTSLFIFDNDDWRRRKQHCIANCSFLLWTWPVPCQLRTNSAILFCSLKKTLQFCIVICILSIFIYNNMHLTYQPLRCSKASWLGQLWHGEKAHETSSYPRYEYHYARIQPKWRNKTSWFG